MSFVQAQGLQRYPCQISQHERLATLAAVSNHRAFGQLDGRHFVGPGHKSSGLVDHAFGERHLDGTGGIAGAEFTDPTWLWIIESINAR